MRHTKIIATIGPASNGDAVLSALINAGTDIVRLNLSHGQALCEAAVTLAERGDARATTDRDATARHLALFWGVTPVRTDGESVDSASLIGRQLVSLGLLSGGAAVVFVSIHPDLARTDANYLAIQRVS